MTDVRRAAVVWCLVALLAACCADRAVQDATAPVVAPTPTALPLATVDRETTTVNLLDNGDFEGGWTHDTIWWDASGGPYYDEFDNIFAPEGWRVWWIDGEPCVDEWVTGRPEFNLPTLPYADPERVRSGLRALRGFTFWRCHWMGALQQVTVEPGAVYEARVWAHAWYSRCSYRPHDSPYDSDCTTPVDWAHDWLRIGIDPTGGIDPRAATVIWSGLEEQYGVYGPSQTVQARATGDTVTVVVESRVSHPLKHNDAYWDVASLQLVRVAYYFPVIQREQ